ncbi:MAG: hypothetical protein ACRDCD_00365 [Mycoplasmoidaceae bacterium]
MKSQIKQKNKIDYNKKFIIKELFADSKIIEMHEKRLKSLLTKETTDEEIQKRINALVVKENAFNTIMEYVSSNFTYSIDKEELENVSKRFAKQFNMDDDKDKDRLKVISEKIIIKSLIFKEIAKEQKISVSDNEAKEYLEKYYKETNRPINELLKSEEKFNEIKEIILEEKITDWLLKSFKIEFDLEKK